MRICDVCDRPTQGEVGYYALADSTLGNLRVHFWVTKLKDGESPNDDEAEGMPFDLCPECLGDFIDKLEAPKEEHA